MDHGNPDLSPVFSRLLGTDQEERAKSCLLEGQHMGV